MNNDMLLGLIRHLLTAFGGVLVAKGTVDQSTVEGVSGGIMAIVGTLWSIASKKSSTK